MNKSGADKNIYKKKVSIPYGKGLYDLVIDNSVDIIKIEEIKKIRNFKSELIERLNKPTESESLSKIIKEKKEICIVISDITRPVPNKKILEVLLPYIHNQGIKKEKIKIIIATGSHEEPTENEYDELIGKYIKNNYKIFWNDCRSDNFIFSGIKKYGHKISVNKDYVESDFKILIGLIEPHLYAGFSGGRKSIVPGLCDWNSFKAMHGYDLIMHSDVRVNCINNNPFHKIATEVTEKVGVDFIINVAINEKREVVEIFTGNFKKAFLKGVEFLRKIYKLNIKKKYDLAITHGGGYPLDSYLYQLVKGFNTPIPYLKNKGMVLCLAELENGLGTEEFGRMICNIKDINSFFELSKTDFYMEQWTIQAFYRIFQKANVYLLSPIFNRYPFLERFFKKVENAEEFILKQKLDKPDFNVGVFLNGPYCF